jgi:hypothetical protein
MNKQLISRILVCMALVSSLESGCLRSMIVLFACEIGRALWSLNGMEIEGEVKIAVGLKGDQAINCRGSGGTEATIRARSRALGCHHEE